jgi:hypothetical protein
MLQAFRALSEKTRGGHPSPCILLFFMLTATPAAVRPCFSWLIVLAQAILGLSSMLTSNCCYKVDSKTISMYC